MRLRELLGRALLELNRLDEAAAEFEMVRVSAPNNLVAGRGLADVQQRGGAAAAGLDGGRAVPGRRARALGYYRRALKQDRPQPRLKGTVEFPRRELAPPAPPEPEGADDTRFDFDRLVEQLGARTPASVQALDALIAELDSRPPLHPAGAQTAPHASVATPAPIRAEELVAALERWLQAVRSSR